MRDLVDTTRNRATGSTISIEVGSWSDDTIVAAPVRLLCETHGDTVLLHEHSGPVAGADPDGSRQEQADEMLNISRARGLARRPWEWCEGCALARGDMGG